LANNLTANDWSKWIDSLETNKFNFIKEMNEIKMFRILDLKGSITNDTKQYLSEYKEFNNDNLVNVLENMIKVNVFDTFMNTAQRQGRISFYMPGLGEEAIMMGMGTALDFHDFIFPQYREQGLLIYRGGTFEELVSQCYGAHDCMIKSRQMPVH